MPKPNNRKQSAAGKASKANEAEQKQITIAAFNQQISQLDESITSLIEPIARDNSEIPEIIHHYTNIDGAYSIITHNTIRLTNLYYLNDHKEYNYGLELFNEIIESKISDERSRLTESRKRFLTLFKESRKNLSIPTFCVACFSGGADKLSQWRAYAANGAGYSIGFDSAALKELSGWKLLRVIYDISAQKSILSCIIDEYLKLSDSLRYIEDEVELAKIGELIASLNLRLDYEIVRFKHPGFEEEDEYRLVLSRELEESQFRPARDMIIPYIDLPGNSGNRLSIQCITIGPTNRYDQSLIINSLFALLKINRFELQSSSILRSSIPYRI